MQMISAVPRPAFTRYFEFFCVDDPDLLNAVFRLRYQVYCKERHLLDPNSYPNRRETDLYDGCSVHFIGRHRYRPLTASTARLVLPSHLGFPLQHHCKFDPEFAFIGERGNPALRHYVEISRLAVSKLFRQRAGDTIYGGPPRRGVLAEPATPFTHPREAGPEVVAGLYKRIFQESKRLGATHWIVAMERGLQLLLRRLGFHFRPIGPVVDYYGPVIPYLLDLDDLALYHYLKRPAVYDYWMDGLEPEYAPDLSLLLGERDPPPGAAAGPATGGGRVSAA